MTWANLNGEQALSARVTIPYYGRWVADVAVAISAATPTRNVLTLGDLALTGYTFRSSEFAGQFLVRLAGGEGGWGKAISPRSYQGDAGIKLSLVLGDVAREVGETVRIDPAFDVPIGSLYVREAGPASRVLRQLAPTWWVDPDGTTRVGLRDASAIASHFDVISYDGERGVLEVATEVLADWMPGRTFTAPTLPAPLVVGSVTHSVTNEGASRVVVLVGATQAEAAGRLMQPLQSFEREDEPRRTFHGVYEYVVQDAGPPVHAVPFDSTLGLPNAVGPLLTVNGGTCKPTVGAECAILFLNGDPTKPRVLAGAADEVDLAYAEGRVARDGDTVTVGSASGTLTITGSTHTHGRSNVYA